MNKHAQAEQVEMQNKISEMREQVGEVSRHLQAALDALPKVDGVEFGRNMDIKTIEVYCGIENLAIALDLPIREIIAGGVRCLKVEDDDNGLSFYEVRI